MISSMPSKKVLLLRITSSRPDVTGTSYPVIVDSTLRDGEQAPGVAFSLDEKRRLLEGLVKVGIQEVEIGSPAMGERECAHIRGLLELNLPVLSIGWVRNHRRDLQWAKTAGLKALSLSVPCSENHQKLWQLDAHVVLETLRENLIRAKGEFEWVGVGAQDATRASAQFLSRLQDLCLELGINRLRIADTLGCRVPWEVSEEVRRLKAHAPKLKLEYHAHNDLGMATANALCALDAGAESASVTLGGIGERAGNARLEEVLVALATKIVDHPWHLSHLRGLSEVLVVVSGRSFDESRPVTGKYTCSHESGLHVEGLKRQASSYEFLDPLKAGLGERQLVVGKHSSPRTLARILHQQGIDASNESLSTLRVAVADWCERHKRCVSEGELLALYKNKKQRPA